MLNQLAVFKINEISRELTLEDILDRISLIRPFTKTAYQYDIQHCNKKNWGMNYISLFSAVEITAFSFIGNLPSSIMISELVCSKHL